MVRRLQKKRLMSLPLVNTNFKQIKQTLENKKKNTKSILTLD